MIENRLYQDEGKRRIQHGNCIMALAYLEDRSATRLLCVNQLRKKCFALSRKM